MKRRIVKDYTALSEEIVELVKLKYPTGYADHLVTYNDKDGKKVSALPFETDDAHYLIRMTINEARKLSSNEEDEEVESPREDMSDIEMDKEFDGEGEDDDEMADGSSDEDDHIIVTRRRDDDEDDIPDSSDY